MTLLALGVPLLFLLVLAAAELPAAKSDRAEAPPWSCLDFHAEHLIFSAKTRLCAQKVNREQILARLPGSQIDPAGLLELTVSSDIVGRRSEESLLFEPASGKVLQRTKLKLGDDPYRKSYRFGDHALESRRSAPHSREEKAAGEAAWSKIEESSFRYPNGDACKVHSEPVLLLYLAAAQNWDLHPSFEICIFADKAWSRVQATSTGLVPFAASYQRNGQERKVEVARRIVLQASPAGEGAGGDPFELMGLRGDLGIFLDPESGLPLAIRGEMPWIGEITVHLGKAELGG